MRIILIAIVAFLAFAISSCDNKISKQNSSNSELLGAEINSEIKEDIGDSIFKIGDYFFEAKKNAKFELVIKGQKPKLKTKGDTLFTDDKIVMLGDIDEIKSFGIYKKFAFKSQFDNFKVDSVYTGKLASPNFATDPNAKFFITRIKEGCKEEGVNFAGHYTIVEWGCGALCQQMAIVDRISGQIIYSQIPFDKVDGHSGTNYKSDSRMLIINTEALSEFYGYESGYRRFDSWRIPAVYEIKNDKLIQIE